MKGLIEEVARELCIAMGEDPDDVVASDQVDHNGQHIEMPMWRCWESVAYQSIMKTPDRLMEGLKLAISTLRAADRDAAAAADSVAAEMALDNILTAISASMK